MNHSTEGIMTRSDWIVIAAIVIPVVSSWFLWLIALPTTHPIKTKLLALMKRVFRTRWKYVSIAFLACMIFILPIEIFTPAPVTRWSTFFISLLVTVILIQSLLIYVISLKQKLQRKIDDVELLTIFNS
jgi:hypothetical protein